MQLVCQGNSLNLRSFTVQEIAELSEILTVQKNAGALISSSDSVGRKLGGFLRVHFESTLVYAEAREL
jgi:hypothetical protein